MHFVFLWALSFCGFYFSEMSDLFLYLFHGEGKELMEGALAHLPNLPHLDPNQELKFITTQPTTQPTTHLTNVQTTQVQTTQVQTTQVQTKTTGKIRIGATYQCGPYPVLLDTRFSDLAQKDPVPSKTEPLKMFLGSGFPKVEYMALIMRPFDLCHLPATMTTLFMDIKDKNLFFCWASFTENRLKSRFWPLWKTVVFIDADQYKSQSLDVDSCVRLRCQLDQERGPRHKLDLDSSLLYRHGPQTRFWKSKVTSLLKSQNKKPHKLIECPQCHEAFWCSEECKAQDTVHPKKCDELRLKHERSTQTLHGTISIKYDTAKTAVVLSGKQETNPDITGRYFFPSGTGTDLSENTLVIHVHPNYRTLTVGALVRFCPWT